MTEANRTEEGRLAANAKALGGICVYPWNRLRLFRLMAPSWDVGNRSTFTRIWDRHRKWPCYPMTIILGRAARAASVWPNRLRVSILRPALTVRRRSCMTYRRSYR
jgi:hypothetical protein